MAETRDNGYVNDKLLKREDIQGHYRGTEGSNSPPPRIQNWHSTRSDSNQETGKNGIFGDIDAFSKLGQKCTCGLVSTPI